MKKLLFLSLTVLSGPVCACGVCADDKVAATYDYEVVERALALHRVVVFGEISGPVRVVDVNERIAKTAPRVPGIQKWTVRLSVLPPAFSFVLDPRIGSGEQVLRELERRLGIPGLSLKLVRVLAGPSVGD